MSEGFHPKPRMNFPSALALGIAGLDEVLEVDLAESVRAERAARRPLRRRRRPVCSSVRRSPWRRGREGARARSELSNCRFPAAVVRRSPNGSIGCSAAASFCIERADRATRRSTCDRLIEDLALADGVLQMTLRA